MSDARSSILRRLRENRPDIAEGIPGEPRLPRPDWNLEQRIELFRENMERVRTEVHVVDSGDWADRLRDLASEKGLKNLLYAAEGPLAGEIADAWRRAGVTTELISRSGEIDEWKEEIFFQIDGAVTSTRGAIAETGTLILWPTAAEPRSYSLVPPVHFAIVLAEQLHATFADAVTGEQWRQGMPSNALLISGPSKSADIEQTLAYGVHGPVEVIVLLVKAAA